MVQLHTEKDAFGACFPEGSAFSGDVWQAEQVTRLHLFSGGKHCCEALWIAVYLVSVENRVVQPIQDDAATIARATYDKAVGVQHVAKRARGVNLLTSWEEICNGRGLGARLIVPGAGPSP
jgi:hypothetical protein